MLLVHFAGAVGDPWVEQDDGGCVAGRLDDGRGAADAICGAAMPLPLAKRWTWPIRSMVAKSSFGDALGLAALGGQVEGAGPVR
ncbi:hypothetical protein ACIBKX_36675 [Streptomyces sp. NPDC050658]|uniref:hypothetical protein n=1 Tax=unclassified Streptomyces TaxID=2593676 RepID=UPI003427085C